MQAGGEERRSFEGWCGDAAEAEKQRWSLYHGLGSLAASPGTGCFNLSARQEHATSTDALQTKISQFYPVYFAIGTTSRAIASQASEDGLRRQTR